MLNVSFRATDPAIRFMSTYFYGNDLKSIFTARTAYDEGRDFALYGKIPNGIAGSPWYFMGCRGPEKEHAMRS